MSAGKKRLLVDQQQQQKQQNRLSRKLTVDTREPYVSIRPVIKKADKEAAYTLSEAYRDDPTLRWITGSIKDEKKRLDFYQDVFKQLIRTAAHVSRELAVQVNGCKGVLVWSEGDNQCLTIHNALGKRGLFSSPGGMSALRAAMTHHRNFSKAKKHAMSGRPHVVINYLGVLASDRRTSLGTSLVKYVLQKADSAQMPVFAEVWGEQNLNWLTRLGFQVYTETRLCSDPSIPSSYYVVREPQLAPDTPLSPTTPSNNLQLEPPREEPVSEEK